MSDQHRTQLLQFIESRRSASEDCANAIAELVNLGFRDSAIAALDIVGTLPGGSPAAHEALGFIAFTLGCHDRSRAHYRAVAAAAPNDAMAWYNLATADRNVGDFEAAEQACDRALALDQQMAQAALLRSSLRVQSPDRNNIPNLMALLDARATGDPARIFLHYALGKELDDLKQYDDAWTHFSAGAQARRQTLDYDVKGDVAKLRRIAEAFGRATVMQPSPSVRFGFIAGLPRSGTTLVERVLTTRPEVLTNGETDNLLSALLEGTPAHGGDIFDRVAAASPSTVASAYARRAGTPPNGGLLLEKMPLNYLYFGAIAKTLPDARIILLQRNLADNGFGMFTTLFGVGYPFSYSQDDLSEYIIAYAGLMRHWAEVLSNSVLQVNYDAFVTNPEECGPCIAEHMGLAWSADMLKVERNTRPTSTASAEQVRRPIYTTASGRWLNYQRHLSPLTDRLSQAGLI